MRPSRLRSLVRAAAPLAGAAVALAGGLAPASAAGAGGWQVAATVGQTGSQTELTSVVATGPRDAWAAGVSCTPGPCLSPSGTLVVARWADGRWAPAPATGALATAPATGLGAVIGASSAHNVWVFAPTPGSHPRLAAYHWNGTTWARASLPAWFFHGSGVLAVEVSAARVRVFSLYRSLRHPFAAVYDAASQTWSKAALPVDPTAVSALSGRDIWLTGLVPSTARAAAGAAPYAVPALAPGTTAGRAAAALAAGASVSASTRKPKLAEAAAHWNGRSWKTVRMPSPYLPKREVYIPIGAAATGFRTLLVEGVASSRNGRHLSQSLLRWHRRHWRRVRLPLRDGIDLFLNTMAQDGHGGAWMPAIDVQRSAARVRFIHYSGGGWTRTASPRYEHVRTSADALAWIPRTMSLWAAGAAGTSHSLGVILRNGS